MEVTADIPVKPFPVDSVDQIAKETEENTMEATSDIPIKPIPIDSDSEIVKEPEEKTIEATRDVAIKLFPIVSVDVIAEVLERKGSMPKVKAKRARTSEESSKDATKCSTKTENDDNLPINKRKKIAENAEDNLEAEGICEGEAPATKQSKKQKIVEERKQEAVVDLTEPAEVPVAQPVNQFLTIPQLVTPAAAPTRMSMLTTQIPSTEAPIPNDLFDFQTQYEPIYIKNRSRKSLLRLKLEPLHERARACYYFYRNEITFIAALELLNRKKYNDKGFWAPAQVSKLREATDCYEKACYQCQRPVHDRSTHCLVFRHPIQESCTEEKRKARPLWCLGCAGRTCAFYFGNDKVKILKKWRKSLIKNSLSKDPVISFFDIWPTLVPRRLRKEQNGEAWMLYMSSMKPKMVGQLQNMAEKPHLRQDCVIYPFCRGSAPWFCAQCCCYICQVPASQCKEWSIHQKAVKGDTEWDCELEERHVDLQAKRKAIFASR